MVSQMLVVCLFSNSANTAATWILETKTYAVLLPRNAFLLTYPLNFLLQLPFHLISVIMFNFCSYCFNETIIMISYTHTYIHLRIVAYCMIFIYLYVYKCIDDTQAHTYTNI
jgi:hypothetical protein